MAFTRSTFPLTAAAVLALLEDPHPSDETLVKEGMDFLARRYDSVLERYPRHFFFHYGHYNAAQAFRLSNDPQHAWYSRRIRRDLVKLQEEDGSWRDNVGPAFATASAVRILQLASDR